MDLDSQRCSCRLSSRCLIPRTRIMDGCGGTLAPETLRMHVTRRITVIRLMEERRQRVRRTWSSGSWMGLPLTPDLLLPWTRSATDSRRSNNPYTSADLLNTVVVFAPGDTVAPRVIDRFESVRSLVHNLDLVLPDNQVSPFHRFCSPKQCFIARALSPHFYWDCG